MIAAAKDSAPVAKSYEQGISVYGQEAGKCETMSIPAIKVLNDRGEFSASMGVLPPWLRPVVKRYVPWYSRGSDAVKKLSGLAVAAVAKRLASPAYRTDLLSKLQQGKDEDGNLMGREELTAEALTQLIAGSDTTSKCVFCLRHVRTPSDPRFSSSCAITYYLAANSEVQRKLQNELDDALQDEDDVATSFEVVKNLPYLNAVINEALRMHSTSGIGLPRIVPGEGMTIEGHFFKEGTVLSVPSYTIHRDREVWGDDAAVYRPERWLERDNDTIQRAFNPFSYGPRCVHCPRVVALEIMTPICRACVGRNLASLELLIIISSIFRRYEIVLEHPEELVSEIAV
jgi:benzoate 4-monooxygenase